MMSGPLMGFTPAVAFKMSVPAAMVTAGDQVGLRVETRMFADEPSAEAALGAGDIDVLVVGNAGMAGRKVADDFGKFRDNDNRQKLDDCEHGQQRGNWRHVMKQAGHTRAPGFQDSAARGQDFP